MKDYKFLFDTVKKIGVWKVGLILVAGIFLISTEFQGSSNNENKEISNNVNSISSSYVESDYSEKEYVSDMEKKIEDMIVSMKNVKTAKVYITIEGGSKKIVLTEAPYSVSNTKENDKNGGERIINDEEKNYNTVYVKNENGKEEPFIVCVKMPEIKGVAVSLEGNITATDEKNIIDMINALTGVGINNITVIY